MTTFHEYRQSISWVMLLPGMAEEDHFDDCDSFDLSPEAAEYKSRGRRYDLSIIGILNALAWCRGAVIGFEH